MTEWLIVGGGISGMLVGRGIRRIGSVYVGVEKGDKLGGRAEVGPHRVYALPTRSFFFEEFSAVDWEFIDDKPQERQKGEWAEVKGELGPTELYYTRAPFYRPTSAFTTILNGLSDEVSEGFRFHAHLETLDLEEKRGQLSNGESISFQRIAWCAPLEVLTKLLREKGPKLPKAARSGGVSGGLSYEARLGQEFFPSRNGIVLPFRYKDHRLRALGFSSPASNGPGVTVSWVLALDKELVDDREEVAKVVRALKREIGKEWPEMAASGERIVYLPRVTGESAPAVDSLELLPDLFYVGAELRHADVPGDLGNLDLVVANYRSFLETLGKGAGEALPARDSEDAVQRDC